jgi:hypothetical protein
MLLNDKDAPAAAPPRPTHRLRRFGKLSFPAIFVEWHSKPSSICRTIHDSSSKNAVFAI